MCNECEKHGQHFAGLAEEVGRLQRECWAASDVLAQTLQRSEAAEARCVQLDAELEASRRAIERAVDAAQAAEARVRAAEGLLRHWQAWICGPSELHKATAAFLATNGETK